MTDSQQPPEGPLDEGIVHDVDVALELPPEPPPQGPWVWIQQNLIGGETRGARIFNGFLTVAFTLIALNALQFVTSYFLDPERRWGAVTANVKLPDMLSFSAYHRFGKFGVMGDATWTRWSSVQRLVINFDTPSLLRSAATVEELRGDDAWRLGLGLNYYHNDKLTLRAGLAYDESPATGNPLFTTARLPDADRYWVAVGASYRVSNKISLDAGYSHLFVDDSRINRTGGTSGDTLTGTFESEADIISVQMNYVFD